MAREKAIRAVHEAKMHDSNIFLTLTYDEDSLDSPWLQYSDFQTFIKDLRHKTSNPFGYMVTGEYGEINKRPHWHAIIFGYRPEDAKYHYSTDHGERVFTSETINNTWDRGRTEFGSVTMDSAGYVARYGAKKLVHGKDQDHKYHPKHVTSSKHAIGKKWIEKYHEHTFNHGFVVLPNKETAGVPRYYEDWLKENRFNDWLKYQFKVKPKIIAKAERQARKEEVEYLSEMFSKGIKGSMVQTRAKVKETILQSKFKKLQENLKL
jgi:hypothetical protein